DDEFVIGCVSRRKKQDQLIKALSIIEKPVKVIFVGIQRDDFPESLVQSVPSRHSLIFCGTVPFDEVLEYYKLFDVSVLPSTTEGLSQALLEAMALAVPVVATDSGGNSELIQDGENGFLFQDEDLEEFAEKIRNVLEDVKLKKKIILNGKSTALETFSVENTVSNHENFFISLLNNE
ncbi:MAG: glycosyltransferase, partial [Candidatus Marinimicrobia bacterium]|nr:glycosyltransferase [Candidatus Neomarinimicrobiota bacterium]